MNRRGNGLVTNNQRRVVFGGMKRERGFDGMRLVQEVALHVLVFVFDTEELEDDSAPAVGMERSDEGLMAAAVQPDHRRFTVKVPSDSVQDFACHRKQTKSFKFAHCMCRHCQAARLFVEFGCTPGNSVLPIMKRETWCPFGKRAWPGWGTIWKGDSRTSSLAPALM